MECREDRRDVVVTTCAGNQTSRRVLYRLKATEVHVGNVSLRHPNSFQRVLAVLLHGTLVVGVSQTLRR